MSNKTEKIDANTITAQNNWDFVKGKELPKDYNYGGSQNNGKVLTCGADGFIRLQSGGGGGEPAQYVKNIEIATDKEGNQSVIATKKDGTEVTWDKINRENPYFEGTATMNNIMLMGEFKTAAGADIDFTGANVDFSGASSVDYGLLTEITYINLKAKRNAGQLTAGSWYRITDYVATTGQADTQSANHPFDLIVFAVTNNQLSETAYAIKHAGDTYFGNSDLTAWEILYCLDNDTDRFAWATASGKGVIYKLTDEYFNTAWYDFKGIQVKNSNGSSDRFYYLFDNAGVDASLNTASTSLPTVFGNKFGFYSSSNNLDIGCNVIKGEYIIDNTIGNFFFENTIGSDFKNNTIGSGFFENTIGSNFENNTIGNYFGSNTIGSDFKNNTIGNMFQGNNTTTQTSQPSTCTFPSGVYNLITTSTTLTRTSKTTFYIGSDNTLKTLD